MTWDQMPQETGDHDMTQVVASNLTLPSCGSDGRRRSNSPAEKHISTQDFGKRRVSPLGEKHRLFFASLCICSVAGKPKREWELLIYGFSFSFLLVTGRNFVAPKRSRI